MFGAGATRRRHLLAQRLARPEEPDAGVRGRQPGRLGKGLDRSTIDLNRLEHLGVCRLQGAREPPDTRADFPEELLVGLSRMGQFLGERRQRPFLGALAPVAVDRGIPEDTIEPWHQPLVGHGRQPVHIARERVLQEVFGQRPVADAPLEEAQKGPVVLDEHAGDSRPIVRRPWIRDARLRHIRSIGTHYGVG